jgi:hypothetical protein
MAAVVGWLVASVVAITVGWMTVGRRQVVTRDPTFDPVEVARRYVTIMGGLAGFAVTGMVLLVTLGRTLPGASEPSFTAVLAMFFVAYIGFLSASVLFGNITVSEPTASIDIPATMFAGGTIMVSFTIAIGWFALRPLFDTVGLHQLAQITGWLLLVASIASYSLTATHLYRTGLVSGRLAVVIPVLAAASVLAFALLVRPLELSSAESTLALTVIGFVVGVPAYVLIAILPAIAHDDRAGPVVARSAPFAVYALAQGAGVLVAFLLLSMLGFS